MPKPKRIPTQVATLAAARPSSAAVPSPKGETTPIPRPTSYTTLGIPALLYRDIQEVLKEQPKLARSVSEYATHWVRVGVLVDRLLGKGRNPKDVAAILALLQEKLISPP